jgi:hypothetical protein
VVVGRSHGRGQGKLMTKLAFVGLVLSCKPVPHQQKLAICCHIGASRAGSGVGPRCLESYQELPEGYKGEEWARAITYTFLPPLLPRQG